MKKELRQLQLENDLHIDSLEEAKVEYFKLQILLQEVERRRDCCFDTVELLAEGMSSSITEVIQLAGLSLNDLI